MWSRCHSSGSIFNFLSDIVCYWALSLLDGLAGPWVADFCPSPYPQHWDYKHVPPCLALLTQVLEIESRSPWALGKPFIFWVIFSQQRIEFSKTSRNSYGLVKASRACLPFWSCKWGQNLRRARDHRASLWHVSRAVTSSSFSMMLHPVAFPPYQTGQHYATVAYCSSETKQQLSVLMCKSNHCNPFFPQTRVWPALLLSMEMDWYSFPLEDTQTLASLFPPLRQWAMTSKELSHIAASW